MKKIFSITIIGILILAGCMVNPQDYETEPENKTPAAQATPTPEEPAPAELTPEEPEEPEEPQTPTIEITSKRVTAPEPEATPEEPAAEPEATPEEPEATPEEPEETEATPEIEEPETVQVRTVDWGAFYNRVFQKGREKYEKKQPWDALAKEAQIKLSSWMVDAKSCKRSPPKEEEIRKIAETLGTSYEWLLYGEN